MSKRAIYIASTKELSGKSIITIALARISTKDLGKSVGYFKPIGLQYSLNEKGEPRDEDAETMRKILNLEVDVNQVCPFVVHRDMLLEQFIKVSLQKVSNKILTAYKNASEEKDLVLIEGPPALSVGSFIGCPVPKLAADFGAKILLVEKYENDLIVDNILQALDYISKWKSSILGVILNQVSSAKMQKAKNVIKPALEKSGINVVGIIPEDKTLSALTVKEIQDAIGGKILAGKDGMNRTVQTVLIGAMTPESAAGYFRKAKDELVITGGDRTDIIFTALEAGVSAMILTGNLYPSVKIFPRADDLRIPIILVPFDTYTTLQMVQKIIGRIKPTDEERIKKATKLVKENVDWKQILQVSLHSN
ncbi:phosphotransacetylase family protein [Candidatus Bathyarchaeota archaeon]|nr:phosphotransacetylase family protein [Candidatus Bathyarchaeota archaeon]